MCNVRCKFSGYDDRVSRRAKRYYFINYKLCAQLKECMWWWWLHRITVAQMEHRFKNACATEWKKRSKTKQNKCNVNSKIITIKTEYGIKLCTHGANATKRKLNCNRRTASMVYCGECRCVLYRTVKRKRHHSFNGWNE